MCIGGPAPGETTFSTSRRSPPGVGTLRRKVRRSPAPFSIVWGYMSNRLSDHAAGRAADRARPHLRVVSIDDRDRPQRNDLPFDRIIHRDRERQGPARDPATELGRQRRSDLNRIGPQDVASVDRESSIGIELHIPGDIAKSTADVNVDGGVGDHDAGVVTTPGPHRKDPVGWGKQRRSGTGADQQSHEAEENAGAWEVAGENPKRHGRAKSARSLTSHTSTGRPSRVAGRQRRAKTGRSARRSNSGLPLPGWSRASSTTPSAPIRCRMTAFQRCGGAGLTPPVTCTAGWIVPPESRDTGAHRIDRWTRTPIGGSARRWIRRVVPGGAPSARREACTSPASRDPASGVSSGLIAQTCGEPDGRGKARPSSTSGDPAIGTPTSRLASAAESTNSAMAGNRLGRSSLRQFGAGKLWTASAPEPAKATKIRDSGFTLVPPESASAIPKSTAIGRLSRDGPAWTCRCPAVRDHWRQA